jgi:hypothetical protein
MFASKDALFAGTVAPAGYTINNSLRFRSSASAYLSRTFATPTNNKIFTWSGWVKIGTIPVSREGIFVAADSPGTTYFGLEFNASAGISLFDSNAAGGLITTSVFRDPSSWYHIVLAVDTTQATAANRIKLYVDGVQITSFSTTNYAAQNSSPYMNRAVSHSIASWQPANTYYLDGYMAEINFVDGQALTPSSFGATGPNSVWQPVLYTGTYGTNGFYLKFASFGTVAALGNDSSGNGNTFTVNNCSITAGTTYDPMLDVPTLTSATVANFPVFNSLFAGRTNSPTNGNLDYGASSVGISTVGMSSGQWYWEITSTGGTTTAALYSSSASTSTTITTGVTKGFRFDASAGTFDYTTNGSTYTSIATGLTSGPYFVYVSTAASTTASLNHGQRAFSYSIPSGYSALNTYNISAGTVTISGSFTGNVLADGPFIWLNGTPTAMTINSNAVTFGTHADKLANGFKVRTSSTSYNSTGTNTYSVSTTGAQFKYQIAQGNP